MKNEESAAAKPTRVPRHLDRLVASGRLTPQEAARLRAGDPAEIDAAAAEIRLRHTRAVLDMAVDEGAIGRLEADSLLDQLRSGEPAADLRARINRLRRAVSSAEGERSER